MGQSWALCRAVGESFCGTWALSVPVSDTQLWACVGPLIAEFAAAAVVGNPFVRLTCGFAGGLGWVLVYDERVLRPRGKRTEETTGRKNQKT